MIVFFYGKLMHACHFRHASMSTILRKTRTSWAWYKFLCRLFPWVFEPSIITEDKNTSRLLPPPCVVKEQCTFHIRWNNGYKMANGYKTANLWWKSANTRQKRGQNTPVIWDRKGQKCKCGHACGSSQKIGLKTRIYARTHLAFWQIWDTLIGIPVQLWVGAKTNSKSGSPRSKKEFVPNRGLTGTFWYYYFGGNPFFPRKGGHGPLF